MVKSVEENPGLSNVYSRRSLELGIPQTQFHRGRILHKGLVLKAYKVQLTQEL